MKKLLILFSLINLTVSGQVINLQRDTIYWYNDMPLSVIKIGEDIRYNQYPVAVIDSLTGNTPGDTLRAYATSTDRDGDSTYSLYRFGYSTDSLGAITWLNNWSPADTMTIPDAMTGKFPVVSVLPKALTGGRTGREVYAWGDSIYHALSMYTASMQFWSGELDFVNNLWLDQSGNNNDLQLVQSNCLNVDSSHYVTDEIPDDLKFLNNQSFTIKLSFTTSEFSPSNGFQGLFSVGAFTNGYMVGLYGDKLRFYYLNATGNASASGISLNKEYTVYCIRDPYLTIDGLNNMFIMYDDGTIAVSNSNNSPTYSTNTFRIGNLVGYNRCLDGKIWNVEVYDTVVLPNYQNFLPIHSWDCGEGYGNYVHDRVTGVRYSITNDGNWSIQNKYHGNLENGATKISYSGNTAYIPYNLSGLPIYTSSYISVNGYYLNAAETKTECITNGKDLPPVETKFQPLDTINDFENFWYTEGVKTPRGYYDFNHNWGYFNYLFCDTTTINKKNLTVYKESQDDDNYLLLRNFYKIPLTTRGIWVKPNGSGDFTTLSQALASISDNTIENRYNIYIDTILNENGLQAKHYVNIIGTDSSEAKIVGYLPEDSDSVTVVRAATIDCDKINFTIRNVTITAQNMRYPIHSDAGAVNGSGRPIQQKFINCRIVHLGNAELESYWGGRVFWNTPDGFGGGLSSNMRIKFINCYAQSFGTTTTSRGISVHSATDAVNYKSKVYMMNTICVTNSSNLNALRFGLLFNNADEYDLNNVTIYRNLYINGSGTYQNNITYTGTNPRIYNGTIICD